MLAARRYQTIRNLTLPLRAFLVTSSGIFVGITAADHASRNFEEQRNKNRMYLSNRETAQRTAETAAMGPAERILAWARAEKYKIVGATWVASMVGSFALVGRNPYLSGQQKIVQARVYAQGLTLAVLVASAGLEIQDQKKGRGILDAKKAKESAEKREKEESVERSASVKGDRGESDLWKDMVAAEESRLKQKHRSLYEREHRHGQKNEAQAESGDGVESKDKENTDEDAAEGDKPKSAAQEKESKE